MIGKTRSHYKILEKLGEGGMGVVYRAEDTKLKREVAIKFLPRQIAVQAKELERFKIEAQAAAALNHPNIATIHAIEDVDDETFIVMEYIHGQELKQKIEAGPLQMDKAIDIATQIASGLQAAHKKGITHRDIKSANIMFTENDQVKIMDFGLAKLTGQTQLTKTGTIMGTVAYMSPEQMQGLKVDDRTDIWSFGVVLYEMLTGDLPFQGDYEHALMYSILHEDPEPVSTLRPDVSTYFEQIIVKALEKDLNARYQNIEELMQDLTKGPFVTTKSTGLKESIVVLPFEDISPNKDNEYFSDGLTEEIITDLSKIQTLRVISRTSAKMLKGTEKDLKTIGRELNVQYVLEGSVRKAGNDLRIVAQLIEVNTDTHLWAEKYKGTLEDVFDIQEEVSRSIVEALKLRLSPEEKEQMADRPIDDVRAYECYFRARQEIWRWNKDALERAAQLLEDGLDIVGENELLYSSIGSVYVHRQIGADMSEDNLGKAEAYVEKIFALNPDSYHGHRLNGSIHRQRGDVQQGVRHLKRALAADPNDTDTMAELSYAYLISGKSFAARPLIKRMIEIDPLIPLFQCMPGWSDLLDGTPEAALEPYRRMYEMDPQNLLARLFYAWTLVWNDRVEEVAALVDGYSEHVRQSVPAQVGFFLKCALQGDTDKALKAVSPELKAAARCSDDMFPRMLAQCYALLNDKQEALDWLEIATRRGFINYPFLAKFDSMLENIRGEARFKQLMKRVKQEWEDFEV